MKILIPIFLLISIAYLLLLAAMFLFQRSLLYYPVPYRQVASAEEVEFTSNGLTLHGWIVNPGQRRAIIYFGGNSEAIENNIETFRIDLAEYSVYLIHYRGYGKSDGKPTESGLFADAAAIYDAISTNYDSISLMGRSLGSGVAVHLAANRKIDKLILVTPYDSIAELAQLHYPFIPARYVARDRFESYLYAPQITADVLIITAELDRLVPVESGLKLREYFTNTEVTYYMVQSATHNNVAEFPEYRRVLTEFIGRN